MVDYKELALKYMEKELNRLNRRIYYLQLDSDILTNNSVLRSMLHSAIKHKVTILNDIKLLKA